MDIPDQIISDEIHPIQVKDIKRVSECNVRVTDRKVGIEDLVESIKKYGLLQPVVLRGSYGNPPYELIVGQRRFLAHKEMGAETIKAVFAKDLDDWKAKLLSLGENMQRVELNHADKAKAITELYIHFKKDERRVAKELGLNIRTVRDYIKIEERATPKAKALLKKGNVTKADLKRVIDAAQGDDKTADDLLDKMPTLSKYEKQRVVEYGKGHKGASADVIIKEGTKQRRERTIILNLTEETCEAIEKAERVLSMDRESIAEKALSDWLTRNGFLKQQV